MVTSAVAVFPLFPAVLETVYQLLLLIVTFTLEDVHVADVPV